MLPSPWQLRKAPPPTAVPKGELRYDAAVSKWVLLVGGVLFFSGCGLDEFEVVLEDEATIPGTFGTGNPFQLNYGTLGSLQLGSQREFVNNDVSPSDVDAIYVRSATVEGTEPQKDNLGVLLSKVELFVRAPGLETRSIAEQSAFSSGPSAVLNVDSALNLKPYATAPSMGVDVEVILKQQPLFQTTLKTRMVLFVDINVAGI